ncbi:uncharacterized protein LOC18423975 isoform X2 [Amborella trichopoda]|nr:uncharacterized protein LOC18423975 isoform X2 [Amborella trichopoda]|eukprot:XP_006828632.2 uncharacterized protein LOC18423975 isoform X2 [Amborella trichopoda]
MVAETEDYSAAATVVGFDPPISLLRGPVPASSIDDPSKGDFVLAFKDERSWRRAFQASEAKLREQCEGHELVVLSAHPPNAGLHGGKAYSGPMLLISRRERDVKREKWLLVLMLPKKLASSLPRINVCQSFEMHALPPRIINMVWNPCYWAPK